MFPDRIHLVDLDAKLVVAWREAFRDLPEVLPERRDLFEVNADAIVAPGNSFGIMDGGIDAAIRDVLGPSIEARVQEFIVARHHGEIHVGCAEVVETGDTRWPFLVFTPTVRVPDDVSRTTNAYVAFRALLLAIRRHNESAEPKIRSVVCPGLCTGIGAMPVRRAAAQMRIAYRQLREPPTLPAFDSIYEAHRKMRTVT